MKISKIEVANFGQWIPLYVMERHPPTDARTPYEYNYCACCVVAGGGGVENRGMDGGDSMDGKE